MRGRRTPKMAAAEDRVRRLAYKLLGNDADVATLFGVSRTAVVNWRTRHGIKVQ